MSEITQFLASDWKKIRRTWYLCLSVLFMFGTTFGFYQIVCAVPTIPDGAISFLYDHRPQLALDYLILGLFSVIFCVLLHLFLTKTVTAVTIFQMTFFTFGAPIILLVCLLFAEVYMRYVRLGLFAVVLITLMLTLQKVVREEGLLHATYKQNNAASDETSEVPVE